jgi:3-oxoacid CoA-transferase A subunit
MTKCEQGKEEMQLPARFMTAREAVQLVSSRSTVMVGGFGLSGQPLSLLDALLETDVCELTVISNNVGQQGQGLGKLLLHNRIKKAIGSYFTSNPDVPRYKREGRLEVELLPQGTFSEAIRLGGSGIPAFYTPTAAGTLLAQGKETRIFNGREYVLEQSLRADIALIKAHQADRYGNLVYYKTARNFNPLMAMAADLTIVEVDEVVEVGELNPESIITPHVFVDIVVVKEARTE